jgi:hypothetical protein
MDSYAGIGSVMPLAVTFLIFVTIVTESLMTRRTWVLLSTIGLLLSTGLVLILT